MPKNNPYTLTLPRVQTLINVIDKGLTVGVGDRVPGEMCVEAAVCYAFGEDHSDRPSCVNREFISTKIDINDDWNWKNDKDRARGLRRLAIVQLGTAKLKGFSMDKLWKTLDKMAWDELFTGKLSWVPDRDNLIEALQNGNNISDQGDVLNIWQNYHVACEKIVQACVKLGVPAKKYLKLAPYAPPKGTPKAF